MSMVQIRKMLLRTVFAACIAPAMGMLPPAGGFMPKTGPKAWAQSLKSGPSGLPLPRFVSLKSAKVNVRRGPGQQYAVVWQFARAGLPVEIIQEFENWRKIRDAEGDEGWVFHSLLSGERAVIVAPWADKKTFALRTRSSEDTAVIAYLEANVISKVEKCDGQWCEIRGTGYQGWIKQDDLWGVYPNEQVGGQ